MPQPKAPRIDWLLEAWHLAELLPQVPSKRLTYEGGRLPLADRVIEHLDGTQEKLNVIEHLDALAAKVNAQMNHAVGKATRTAAQRKQMPRFEGTDVRVILATADAVLAMVSGTDSDLGVVDVGIAVHQMLASVRQHRQLSDDQRVKLVVVVAALAGGSVAVQNAINAQQKRPGQDREGPIRRIVRDERSHDRHRTWAEVLDSICSAGADAAVREVIIECRDGRLHYWWDEEHGERTSMGLDRFQAIFNEEKPQGG